MGDCQGTHFRFEQRLADKFLSDYSLLLRQISQFHGNVLAENIESILLIVKRSPVVAHGLRLVANLNRFGGFDFSFGRPYTGISSISSGCNGLIKMLFRRISTTLLWLHIIAVI